MSENAPKNNWGLPSEFEEPYFATARTRDLAVDAGVFANAENSQLQFMSEGTVGWDATGVDADTGLLYWNNDIYVTPFTVPIAFRAKIAGPASVELQDGEVLYFVMPRSMIAETTVQLYRSNRIFLQGTRLHDLRLFAARVGTTVYFYNGKSLKDGDLGLLFGGGLITTSIFPPHEHMPTLTFNPPPATTIINIGITTAGGLARAYLYRNGLLQSEPDDYSLNPATGIVTLVVPVGVPPERFVVLREKLDTSSPVTTHTHLSTLVINPLPATTLLDMLVMLPTLQGVDLFRNGMIQVDPTDYSIDMTTGFVTLVTPTVLAERFVALRRINI